MKKITLKNNEKGKIQYSFETFVPVDIQEAIREWGAKECLELIIMSAKIKIAAMIRGVLESGDEEKIRGLGSKVLYWKPSYEDKKEKKVKKALKLIKDLSEDEVKEILKRLQSK